MIQFNSKLRLRITQQYTNPEKSKFLTVGPVGQRGHHQGYTRCSRAMHGIRFPTSTALHSLYPPDMLQIVTRSQVLVSGAFIFATWSAWKLFIKSWFSPLRRIPGPRSKSFIWGNIVDVDRAEDISKVWQGWFAEFGHVFVSKGFFNVCSTRTPPEKTYTIVTS